MRVHFDVLTRVHVDADGIEVANLSGAVEGARCAIAELACDDRPDWLGPHSFLLVRVDDEGSMWVIPIGECSPPIPIDHN